MLMVYPDYPCHIPMPWKRVSETTLYNLQQLDSLPVTAEQICKATRNNPILLKVKQHTLTGWPQNYEQVLTLYY